MKTETVQITTEFIRLDALLKFAGVAMSGGEAVGETPSELDGHFQNVAARLLGLVRGGRRSRIIPIKEKAS